MSKNKITNHSLQDVKGNTWKRSICYLLPALCYLLIVAACPNQPNLPKVPQTTPHGYGYFSLHDEVTIVRTILPQTVQEDFLGYTLVFTYLDDSSEPVVTEPRTNNNLAYPVLLRIGKWKLEVTAFMDADRTLSAATGSIEITIVEGETTYPDDPLLLNAIRTGTGTGSFNWNINFPDDAVNPVTVTITITPMPPGTPGSIDPITSAGKTDTLNDIPVGQYSVTFELKRDNYKTVNLWDIMRVYQNMTSRFPDTGVHNFTDFFIYDFYNVTFNENYIDGSSTPHSVLHGTSVSEPTDAPTRTNYIFDGWYTDNGTFANQYDFNAPVLNDITLYAKWLQAGDFGITKIDLYDYKSPVIDSELELYKPGSGMLNEADLSVENHDLYESIEWIYNGAPISGAPISGTNGETITLNAADYPMGTLFLTVRVRTVLQPTIPFTRTVSFTVIQNAAAPQITVQPKDASYDAGQTPAPLFVTASSPDDGALSYQWYHGGSPISGAIGTSYTPVLAYGMYSVEITNTNNTLNGKKTEAVTSDVVVVTMGVAPGDYPFVITGSAADGFSAALGGVPIIAGKPIQDVIDEIRIHANGTDCEIQFGDGTNVLDIGANSIVFGNTWGKITLSGSITIGRHASNNYGISFENAVSADIKGSIVYTGTITLGLTAIQTSSGTFLTVDGGTVSTSTARTISNSSGTVIIKGGTVSSEGTAITIVNSSAGTVEISGGTVSATNGTAISNSSEVTINGGAVSATSGTGISNTSSATLIMSGGTVSATTGSAISNTNGTVTINGGTVNAITGRAIYVSGNFASVGKIIVSETAEVTSGNTNAARGTIHLEDTNASTAVRLEITGGTVQNTVAGGNAIYNNTHGGVTISGGTVQVTTGRAIHNQSTGDLTITGGRVEATESSVGYAFYNNGTGAVNDDPTAATIIGLKMYSPLVITITSGNVMQILQDYIHDNLDRYYKLEGNIDLSSVSNWKIIGEDDNPFTGTFDGGGFTISNMTIIEDNPNNDNRGLFGAVSGTVKNLGLVNVNISVTNLHDNRSTGGIAGIINQNGRLENCFVIGSVEGKNNVGGLVGWNDGIVRNSYFIGSVKGNNRVGGLVGSNARVTGGSHAILENSYAAGTVQGNNTDAEDYGVGGLAGGSERQNDRGGGIVRNSVALNSSVTGNYNVGRVRGSSTDLTLTNNYGRADMILPAGVTAESNEDGIHGENITVANWGDEAWWTASGRWNTSTGTDWDFDNVWEWNDVTKLPILRGLGAQNHRVLSYLESLIYNAEDRAVITLPPGTDMVVDSTITVDKEITITASPGEEAIIHRSSTVLSPAITVKNGGKLTLESNGGTLIIAVSAGTAFPGGSAPLISVEAGGQLLIDEDVEITSHTGGDMSFRAIEISGSVTMTGGKINGFLSRGAVAISGGTFTMSGGSITGNSGNSTTYGGGGVAVDNGGTFTMTGGEISDNRSGSIGGGGVCVRNGTFNMHGGIISNNYFQTSSFDSSGGGGVHVNNNGKFNMYGGEISGNYVTTIYQDITYARTGGGVFVQNGGTFSKTGGSTIYGMDAWDTFGTDGQAKWNRITVSPSPFDLYAGRGYAVYWERTVDPLFRDNTAGHDYNMSTVDASGWE